MSVAAQPLTQPVVNVPSRECTPLPLPALICPTHPTPTHYAVTVIDDRGRLCDTSVVGMLGWRPGQAITYSALPAAAGVVVERGGAATVNGRGRLLLPLALRRALHLEPGDHMLVAAHLDRDVLVAYTMTALDAMTSWLHASHGAPA